MINLLPDETKRQIRAARANTSLIKYVIFLGFSVVFLGLACGTAYLSLMNSKTSAENIIANSQSKNNSNSSVTSQYNTIVANFAIASSILNQQVSYSNIIMDLAAALPTGTVLDTISLTNDTLNAPMALKIRAKTTDAVATIKANFQKSSMFSNYSLQSLSSSASNGSGYPVEISIGITINKNAAL
jgi:Tfp pilus assembly protein PilN